jgi:hypothetical protein
MISEPFIDPRFATASISHKSEPSVLLTTLVHVTGEFNISSATVFVDELVTGFQTFTCSSLLELFTLLACLGTSLALFCSFPDFIMKDLCKICIKSLPVSFKETETFTTYFKPPVSLDTAALSDIAFTKVFSNLKYIHT